MKTFYTSLLFCCCAFFSFSQVPNGDFEEWEIRDSLRDTVFYPVSWVVVNEQCCKTIERVEDALSGNYSLKVTNLGGGFEGPIFGAAITSFYANKYYDSLSALIRIDTISPQISPSHSGASISIAVREKSTNRKMFLKFEEPTNGVFEIIIPIKQTGLGFLNIEIFATSRYRNSSFDGYAEVIIDDLRLSEGLPPLVRRDTAIICKGDSYQVQDTFLNRAGNHALFFPNPIGADSLYWINLTVLDTFSTTIDTSLLLGESFEGFFYQNDTLIQKNLIASNGCDSLVLIQIMVETSFTENLLLGNEVQIYPNPTSEVLHLKFAKPIPKPGEIVFYNWIGQKIFEQPISENITRTEVDISDFPPGIYFLSFKTEGREVTLGKILVE